MNWENSNMERYDTQCAMNVPPPTREVPKALDELDEGTEALRQSLDALADRLQVAMRPATTGTVPEKEAEASRVPLAKAIHELVVRVYGLRGRVEDLLQRLEL